MRIPNDKEKYSSSWRYQELARYIPSLDRIIRIKKEDDPVLVDVDRLEAFREKYNNIGLYTSIWHYNTKDIDTAERLGSLYFDIDNKDVNISLQECQKLYTHLCSFIPEESLIVYYTGKKGFHIECEALALGITKGNNLHNIFRYIANDLVKKLSLTSLDFSVYDLRRMWRMPGSIHQDTKLYKTKLSKEILFSNLDQIVKYSSSPHDYSVPEQDLNLKAASWYGNYVIEMEVEKNKPKDPLAYFNEHGSRIKKTFDNDKTFDKVKLKESCSAVARMENEARENKYLDHESRLFLCSILTYTDEAIEYLHRILSYCSDYNVNKSSAHINDWIKRREAGIGGRPYTCERANSAGVGCGDCSLEHKNKWVKIGDSFVETSEKISPSPIRFAYNNIKKGEKQNGKQ
jgi:hypothetical protein